MAGRARSRSRTAAAAAAGRHRPRSGLPAITTSRIARPMPTTPKTPGGRGSPPHGERDQCAEPPQCRHAAGQRAQDRPDDHRAAEAADDRDQGHHDQPDHRAARVGGPGAGADRQDRGAQIAADAPADDQVERRQPVEVLAGGGCHVHRPDRALLGPLQEEVMVSRVVARTVPPPVATRSVSLVPRGSMTRAPSMSRFRICFRAVAASDTARGRAVSRAAASAGPPSARR